MPLKKTRNQEKKDKDTQIQHRKIKAGERSQTKNGLIAGALKGYSNSAPYEAPTVFLMLVHSW